MQEILKQAKDMKGADFEVHRVQKTSDGYKSVQKIESEAFMKYAQGSVRRKEIEEELKDTNFNDRYEWIRQRKNEGNRKYNKQKYQEAAQCYLEALAGIPKSATAQQAKKLTSELEIPCYSNISLCLKCQNKFPQALEILDIILQKDSDNVKAHVRKLELLHLLNRRSEFQAELYALQTMNHLISEEMKARIAQIKHQRAKERNKEESVFKNMMKGGLYGDKVVQGEDINKNGHMEGDGEKAKDQESQYLESLGLISWMLYPYKKMITRILCRRKYEPWRK